MLQTRRCSAAGKERVKRWSYSDHRNKAQPATDEHSQGTADKLNAIGGIHGSDFGLEMIVGAVLVLEAGANGFAALSR